VPTWSAWALLPSSSPRHLPAPRTTPLPARPNTQSSRPPTPSGRGRDPEGAAARDSAVELPGSMTCLSPKSACRLPSASRPVMPGGRQTMS